MAELDQRSQDNRFMSLIIMLAGNAWAAIGKVPDPESGKVEKNLQQAQAIIDLLAALKDKTRGNLAETEDRLLSNTIADLQLNYADEAAREPQKPVN